jgi:uncharacterized membrane protein YkoI
MRIGQFISIGVVLVGLIGTASCGRNATKSDAGGLAVSQAATPSNAAYVGAQLAPNAKITMDQARAIALAARPGQITDQELENEGGGSGLRYSFDINSGGKVHEVGVDAQTGRVLENAAEGPHPD